MFVIRGRRVLREGGGVTYWDEGEVEDTPDYVEAPVKCADAGGRDFDDHEIEDPRGLVSRDCKVCCVGAYQFVAVPKAAPFVRIAIELISVGYS